MTPNKHNTSDIILYRLSKSNMKIATTISIMKTILQKGHPLILN